MSLANSSTYPVRTLDPWSAKTGWRLPADKRTQEQRNRARWDEGLHHAEDELRFLKGEMKSLGDGIERQFLEGAAKQAQKKIEFFTALLSGEKPKGTKARAETVSAAAVSAAAVKRNDAANRAAWSSAVRSKKPDRDYGPNEGFGCFNEPDSEEED